MRIRIGYALSERMTKRKLTVVPIVLLNSANSSAVKFTEIILAVETQQKRCPILQQFFSDIDNIIDYSFKPRQHINIVNATVPVHPNDL